MTPEESFDSTSAATASTSSRLPDASRPGRVRLQVGDLRRSLSYYESVLGLRVLRREGSTASLGAAESSDTLVELVERAGARPSPVRRRTGLFHFAILLPDRAALGRFVTHLAAQGVHAGSSDHLVSEALYLQDPDGLGIEVYADRPRSTWRRRGSELAMESLPLDLADVARAGGGVPWSGMPAGTVMGHVHLHVRGIPEAESFYGMALGLDVMVRGYPGALFLSAGGYHHHLGLNIWAGSGATPPAEDESQLLDWELLVPGREQAQAAAARLTSAGHAVVESARGWRMRDPSGTPMTIVAA